MTKDSEKQNNTVANLYILAMNYNVRLIRSN